ncbi:hypothetical protein [Nocardiopsis sp. FR4]|uniref:hypothetical protein n=1 Tax=Nocardiopsis sp. FR4 TaxID=2605985 RepID=UPI00135B1E77|nr:hypothetical protein [Nocardiopsis sp. FR4]
MPRTKRGIPPLYFIFISFLALAVVGSLCYIKTTGVGTIRSAGPLEKEDPCENPTPRETCSFVATGSGTSRYGFIRGTGEEAVIVDVGGPGSSILSGSIRLEELASSFSLPNDYSFVFVEEPWVQKDNSEDCRNMLQTFYAETRKEGSPNSGSAEALVKNCQIENQESWSFTKESYSEIVEAIEIKEDVKVKAFLGYSFGSARLSYLEGRDLDWVTLIRPFPVGASGEELINSRANQAQKIISNMETSRLPGGNNLNGRSIPVEEFDYISAEIALGYLTPREISVYSDKLRERQDDQLAGELSDSLWLRYGESSMSPAYLSYLSEVCNITSGWPQEEYSSHSHLSVISGMHTPCSFMDGQYQDFSVSSKETCVVVSENDPLTDPGLIRRYFEEIEDVTWIESKENSHHSSDGTMECLNAIQK